MIRKMTASSIQCGERAIALHKRRYTKSLSLQLLAWVLASLLAAVIAFGVFYFLGNKLIDKTVYSEKFSAFMSEQSFKRLQVYVTQEGITKNNIYRLNVWCNHEKEVCIIRYICKRGVLSYIPLHEILRKVTTIISVNRCQEL